MVIAGTTSFGTGVASGEGSLRITAVLSIKCISGRRERRAAIRICAEQRGGINTKIHLAVDANGMPVRILVTEGTRADCKEEFHLIEGISAEILLADRGYDTNDILAYVVPAGMEPVSPPKKNRKEQRDYDKYLYKLRHLVENCFLILKCWKGIATRYAKTSDAFIAAVHVRCIAIWAAIHA